MYARYSIPSTWDEMDRLQREMNRLYSTNWVPPAARTAVTPP
jgi:hypothetical protein